jgi:hypothetical protein
MGDLFVGEALAGETVGIEEVEDGWLIWFGPLIPARLDARQINDPKQKRNKRGRARWRAHRKPHPTTQTHKLLPMCLGNSVTHVSGRSAVRPVNGGLGWGRAGSTGVTMELLSKKKVNAFSGTAGSTLL